MKKIMITGSHGQLGRALNKIYENHSEYVCVNTDVGELDITDVDAVNQFVSEIRPYAIINCAAHTNVNGCETDIDNAYRINAVGPRNLAIAAERCHAKLMHISTDYVFDGQAAEPYTEFCVPNPKAVYGKTKLAGENFVKEFSREHFIIRTAWLYGDGKNFVRTCLDCRKTMTRLRLSATSLALRRVRTSLRRQLRICFRRTISACSMAPARE